MSSGWLTGARRLGAAAIGALYGASALYMLLSPLQWLSFMVGRPVLEAFPGMHFLLDVALALLASAAGLLLYAARPQFVGALVIGAAFPFLHAVLHLVEMAQGEVGRFWFDIAVLVAPAFAAAAIAASALLSERSSR
ncbi:MAG: hypothetical protein AB7G40_18315 [Hyphomonadaceae bacterium]